MGSAKKNQTGMKFHVWKRVAMHASHQGKEAANLTRSWMKEVRESLFDFILVAISKSSLDQLISSLEAQFTWNFF